MVGLIDVFPGAIVRYCLTIEDCHRIRAQRDSTPALVGNQPSVGDELPLIVVWTHPDPAAPIVNGQVFLDGNDSLWVYNRPHGVDDGEWH